MFASSLRRPLCRSSSSSCPALVLASGRTFASSPPLFSKVGRTPIAIPPGVKLIEHPPPPNRTSLIEPPRQLEITGPLGTSYVSLPHYVTLTQSEDTISKATVSVADFKLAEQSKMWGTTRALIALAVTGVSEGHTAILRLVGVGYRAVMEQDGKIVNLKVGYAHPVELKVPDGVKASTPAPTRILLEGRDKQAVNMFAAKIRVWRKPEPYKGKGIFVNNETIKLKAKKIK